MDTVTAFVGTDPEAYVKLMDQFFGIVWKMGLEATYKEAGKNLAMANTIRDTH